MIIKELLSLREAKAKGVAGKAAKPDFLNDPDTPIGQLEQLPQPIGINGGSYTYWVDVTKTPLKFVASDGSEVDEAKTLEDIAKWMDRWAANLWLEFLKGDEDLEGLRAEGIIRSKRGGTDQRSHERQMHESVDVADIEAKMIALVLPKLKRYIEDHNDIDHFVDAGADNDYLYAAWQELVPDDKDWTDEHSKVEKKLGKMRANAWRALFKEKYGVTDKEILARLEKEGEAKLSEDELKFMKYFGNQVAQKFSIIDLNPKEDYHLRIYMKSPTKLVITSPMISGLLFTDESLKRFNLSIEKVIAMFNRFGIKLGKRPVHKRVKSYSLYD